MQLWVRTHQGGDNRLSIAFTQATEIQSRPPAKIFFLNPPSVKEQFVKKRSPVRRERPFACALPARPPPVALTRDAIAMHRGVNIALHENDAADFGWSHFDSLADQSGGNYHGDLCRIVICLRFR
jgi:hypothetical protein